MNRKHFSVLLPLVILVAACAGDTEDSNFDPFQEEEGAAATVEQALGSSVLVKNANSGMHLNIFDNNKADATPVIQFNDSPPTLNSQFTLESTGDGYYKLVAAHSGKCIDVMSGMPYPGAPIQQWTCLGGNNQRFKFETLANGKYAIRPKNSNNQCLEVFDSSMAAGTGITQNNCAPAKLSQQWTLAVP
jgi:hypothetical protein